MTAQLDISATNYADCRHVSVEGRIDHTNSDRFLEQLSGLAADVPAGGGMVLDLSKLDFITSAGLRAMLMADRTIKAASGKFVVSGIGGVVREVFRISKFDALLSTAETTAEGMAIVSDAAADAFSG